MYITPQLLNSIYKETTPEKCTQYAYLLRGAMSEFGIDDSERRAMFLAQVGHESGQLRYVEEIASGAAYEGRLDLGNIQPGDGIKFKGRGLIQITGRHNYRECGKEFNLDLLSNPKLLSEPKLAARSAGWFWWKHKLNRFADVGDIEGCTRAVNGGLNGYKDRVMLYKRALAAL
jgi:putative chitinase